MNLIPSDSMILVIDIQEKFRPHIEVFGNIERQVTTLLQAAEHLSVPALIFEQYPKGLAIQHRVYLNLISRLSKKPRLVPTTLNLASKLFKNINATPSSWLASKVISVYNKPSMTYLRTISTL